MKKKMVGFSSLMGVLTAACGILAPRAHALGWCPTASDYMITCSGCTRELICDPSNVSIFISGSDVTLNGMGHTLWYPPNAGIKVFKPGAIIKSITIRNAGGSVPEWAAAEGSGIYIIGSTLGTRAQVENVIVDRSRGHGLWNASVNSVKITDGHFSNNGLHGVYGAGSKYTELWQSSATGNTNHGYVTTASGSWVINSILERNKTYGMYSNGLSDLIIQGNRFSYNHRGLFLANAIAPRVYNNYGIGNTAIDCYDSGSTNGNPSGNTWASNYGINCSN